MQQYFIDLLEERRRHGRDDLVTHFVRSDVDGIPFASEQVTPTSEVSGLMMVLFHGGVESTAGERLPARSQEATPLCASAASAAPPAEEGSARRRPPGESTNRFPRHTIESPKNDAIHRPKLRRSLSGTSHND